MKQNVLFFWIPKAAGSSIYQVLKKHDCPKLYNTKRFRTFNNQGFVTFGHIDVNYLLKHKIIKKTYFKDAFKFCFVRNPWDRLVSLYHYRKGYQHISFEKFVYMIDKRYKRQKSPIYNNGLFQALIYNYPLLRNVISRLLRESSYKLNCMFPVPPIGPYNVFDISQANPQTDWITDKNGNLIVDQVCKFEDLEKDFKKICDRIGIDEELPHVNKSKHRHYRQYYNKNTKEIVSRIYQSDIKMFGYSF